MLDTVKIESPPLASSQASAIEHLLELKQGYDPVDFETGERVRRYEITVGSLEGSHDSRVSVRVMRERPVKVAGETRHKMRCCRPYLWVEGSIHKALLGHNVYGGPEDLQGASEWFVGDLGARVGVPLPEASEWLLRRADWAETYRLPYEGCEAFVWALNNARYPRRKPARYAEETTFFPGVTTAVKLYHKGPEFAAHDSKRLRWILKPDELARLQWAANETLRAEVQVKARKLRDDFGELPRIAEVTEDYLKPVHDRELEKILRDEDGERDMKKVRTQKQVLERLHQIHGQRLAGVLFGTWMQLATLGEAETRRHMSTRTFYRHRKQLQEAGVAWLGSDLVTLPSVALPADFQPLRTDPRHVTGEHPTVSEKLAPFRAA